MGLIDLIVPKFQLENSFNPFDLFFFLSDFFSERR